MSVHIYTFPHDFLRSSFVNLFFFLPSGFWIVCCIFAMFVCSFRLKLKLIQRKARTISSRHIVNNLLRHFSLPLLSNMKMNPNLVFSILPPCIFFFSLSCARAGPCYREKGGDRKMVKSTRETQIFFRFFLPSPQQKSKSST